MRLWPAGLVLALATAASARQGPQCETQLRGRWVGYNRGDILKLEFYGDSMLVVNDQYAPSYHAAEDSLIATGDTNFAARYRFAYCRLLLETADGTLITMSSQQVLARPLTGRWLGDLGTSDGAQAELLLRPNGTARWHSLPDGPWTEGEWERQTRIINFTWAGADSVSWVGHYDVEGNALLFDHTIPGSRAAIFRRVFR